MDFLTTPVLRLGAACFSLVFFTTVWADGAGDASHANGKTSGGTNAERPNVVTAKGVMQYLDRDRNQTISLEEYLRSRPDDRAGKVLDDFKSLDKNDDGGIDVTEAGVIARYANQERAGSERDGNAGASPSRPQNGSGGKLISAKQIIESMDRDGDGKITPEEAIEDVRVAFDELDSNGDGKIDLAEADAMAKFANQSSLASQERDSSSGITAEQLVVHMDQNNDRRISMDEATEELKPHFVSLDTNQDGFLDIAEAQAVADYVNQNQ